MEYAPGGTLHDVLMKSGAMPSPHAKSCIRDVLSAIEYLHARRIVHRDLKLKNILMKNPTHPYDAQLADFGLSNFLATPHDDSSQSQNLKSQVGSPHFVAPEVLSGAAYGPAVDLWACGILTFNMATGRYPFAGRSVQETLKLVARGTIDWDRAQEKMAFTEPEAIDFMKGLLERDPRRRLSAAQALRHPWLRGAEEVGGEPSEPMQM